MTQPQVERRGTRRFPLNLPVSVRYPEGGNLFAHTRDVSSRGICIYMSRPAAIGSELDFTLTLTPEITLTEAIRVRCLARVVRVEESAKESHDNMPAVAAVIERYDFLAGAP